MRASTPRRSRPPAELCGARDARVVPRTARTVALGNGLVVPYPEPSSDAATAVGRGNRRSGTAPEVALRSALHRRGYRFRKDLLVRAGDLRTKPDIVFTRQKVAVYVDGCFWHGCPEHGTTPKTNQGYWIPKLERNRQRDTSANEALASHGWTVIRVWEHETLNHALALVQKALD